MPTLLELLRDGYFPKELPQPFTTKTFASVVTSPLASLPNPFLSGSFMHGKPCAFTSPYHIARAGTLQRRLGIPNPIAHVGTLQRRLGIPNPIAHFRLCNEIHQNWATVYARSHTSQLSMSRPTSKSGASRAIFAENTLSVLPSIRANRFIGGKYLLKTDITRYYHSIYTHSISWAIHGKSVAKANRSLGLLGNKLDKLVRDGQDGQTVGIPVGPDTSLLISEIILAAVDDLLTKTLKNLRGFRHMDDYELCFPTLAEAENALHLLESTLADFELSLNPLKTEIQPPPLILQESWATELGRFEIRDRAKAQEHDLIGYFNRALELASRSPTSSVLRYAIPRLRGQKIDAANGQLFQDLLLHCASSEPGTILYVLEQFASLHNDGHKIYKTKLKDALNAHIRYHANMGHTSEVAWPLWGALVFNVQLSTATANALAKLDNSVVALLALDAENRGLFKHPLHKSLWARHLTRRSLYEENWLLSYEANVKGWMKNPTGVDHVAADDGFGFLKKHGVEFYDLSQAAPVRPGATQPWPGETAY